MHEPNLIVLAAGISSRMKRAREIAAAIDDALLTDADTRSKSLIRVGHNERPFLDYVLARARDAGYRDIVLVIGEADELMREYYGHEERDNAFHGLRISYALQRIPSGRSKPLGTADATVCGMTSRPDWKGTFVTVCNSDNLYTESVLARLMEDQYRVCLPAYDREGLEFAQERIERFSILERTADGRLLSILEKPEPQTIERVRTRTGRVEVSMNIFRFDYDFALPFLTSTTIHPVRQEKEIPTALSAMIADHPDDVHCFTVNEHVPDLTGKEDIVDVRRYLREHFSGPPFG